MKKLTLLLLSFSFFWNISCGIQNAPRAQYNSLPNGVEGLVIVSGNSQIDVVNAQLSDPLTVAAYDKRGQPMVSAQVEFVIEAGAVELFTPISQTAKDGVASTAVRLGVSAGASRVRARLLPDPTEDAFRSVYFDLNALRDGPSKLKVIQGKIDSTICAEDTWVVKLTDEFGNGIPNGSVSVKPSGFTVNHSSSALDFLTGADGTISFKVNGPTAKGAGTLTLEGPSKVAGDLTLNFARDLQLTSNRGNYYELPENQDGSFTLTLRNGCGVLPGRTYWKKQGQDAKQAKIPDLPGTPTGNTNSAGQIVESVESKSEGSYYYYAFRADDAGESAFFDMKVYWSSQ